MKVCAECKHFEERGPHGLARVTHKGPIEAPRCRHPEAISRDAVYGVAYCETERAAKKGCGKEARLWVAK